jgi:small subunit ribosomal protein S4e
MGKKHLKRLNMPKTWNVKRKGITYIKRPNPGAHSFKDGMALSTFLKNTGFAKNEKEVKNILNKQEVLINGIRRHESKFIVGFMDVIAIPAIKAYFRVLFNKKGKITTIKIDEKESQVKICKINCKRMHKKGLQLNLSDGRNIFADKKEFKVGDSVLIDLPKQNIKEIIKFEVGSLVILIGGKKIGKIVVVEEIKGDVMKYKDQKGVFETLKKYAFVLGKEKAMVKIEE